MPDGTPEAPGPDLDVDLMRTFVAICETGNFTRAAERIHRTPSAVSVQVKRLEETLGRPLFARHTRSVALTPDGETLLGSVRRLLKLNDELVAQFRRTPMQGRVSFGAPNDSGILALPSMLRRFASTHPLVEVEVRLDASGTLRERCEAGEIDLVLFTASGAAVRDAEVVHSEDLVWIGLRDGLALDAHPLPLALCSAGCAWPAAALDALSRAGIPYRIAYTSDHCQGQIAAVEADLAVAPLPASVAVPPFARLDDRLPPLGRYDVFMKHRSGAGAAVKALAGHIAQSFRDTAGRGTRLFA